MELCASRVRSAGNTFKELGNGNIREFELSDPQFIEALKIAGVCGNSTPALLGANAIVAYMLSSRGEDFWHSFSGFSISRCGKLGIIDVVVEFTKYNNLFNVRSKLKRLSKLRSCPELMIAIEKHDLLKYWSTLAKCLKVGKESKTVVFSVKMVYYGLKALGVGVELPDEVPIPVDRRVSLLTVSSGIISFNGCYSQDPKPIQALRRDGEVLMKRPKLVREAWRKVSQIAEISPIHLDAPLWVIGRYFSLGSRKKIFEVISKSIIGERINRGLLKALINELYFRLPP